MELSPAPVPVRKITSLADLKQAMRQPVAVPIGGNAAGEVLTVEALPLTAEDYAQVRGHVDRVMPPVKRNETTGAMEMQLDDKPFLEARARAENEGRALAIYLGCPALWNDATLGVPPSTEPPKGAATTTAPPLKDIGQIHKLVYGTFTEMALRELEAVIVPRRTEGRRYLDFF